MGSGFDFSKLVPFVIFLLGILCSPFIEWTKEKSKARRLKKLVISSLSDELENTKDAIQFTINTIKDIENINIARLSLHTPINIKVLEKYYLDIFPVITKEQRKGFNLLMLHIELIEEKSGYIKKNWKEENISDLVSKLKTMLNSIIIVDFYLYEMSTRKKHFKLPKQNDNAIVKSVLERYNITDIPMIPQVAGA